MGETIPLVVPMLSYEDGVAALDWLCRAFGFRERTRMLDDAGRLVHGELLTEAGGLLMLASPTADYRSPKRHRETCDAARKWLAAPWVIDGVLVYVDDVDAHHARAVGHGATMLGPIEKGFPGRRYRTEDLEGHRWMFIQRPTA